MLVVEYAGQLNDEKDMTDEGAGVGEDVGAIVGTFDGDAVGGGVGAGEGEAVDGAAVDGAAVGERFVMAMTPVHDADPKQPSRRV